MNNVSEQCCNRREDKVQNSYISVARQLMTQLLYIYGLHIREFHGKELYNDSFYYDKCSFGSTEVNRGSAAMSFKDTAVGEIMVVESRYQYCNS
jgi:hypothetical protein